MTSITQSLSTKTKVAGLALAAVAAALMMVCLMPSKAFASPYLVYVDPNGGTVNTVPTGWTKDTNGNAYYKTFDGGTTFATIQSEWTGKITAAAGYEFKEWYDAGAGVVISSPSTWVVDSLESIKANWKALEYTVTFDTKGGSAAPAAQTVAYGAKVTKPADPTKEGKVFDGWFQDIGGGMGVAWNFDSETVASDITLIATWKDAPASDDTSDSTTDSTIAATGDNTPFVLGGVALVVAAAGLVIASRKLGRKEF